MSTYLKSIINKLSPESRSILDSAINYAISRSHHEVDCLHFLWKLLQEHKSITEKFSELSLFNPDRVLNAIESELILSIRKLVDKINPSCFTCELIGGEKVRERNINADRMTASWIPGKKT
jgi:ATP-dependent Clp protease ATP-binding subunit ClpA